MQLGEFAHSTVLKLNQDIESLEREVAKLKSVRQALLSVALEASGYELKKQWSYDSEQNKFIFLEEE